MYPTSNGFSLWGDHGISFNDARQGQIGNCWAIAAISSIAEDPDRIEDTFVTKKLNDEDVYSMTLYPLGTPADITIDGRIPGRNWANFAGAGRDKSLWVPLIEKAMAKDYGTYAAMEGGFSHTGVASILGSPGRFLNHRGFEIDQLWRLFQNGDKRGDMINTMPRCEGLTKEVGLICIHAYTVIGPYELSNGVRLVKVRNPWATEGYHGDWSDKSELWTDELRAEVGAVVSNDGVFFMTIDDFKETMEVLFWSWNVQH